MQSDRRAVYQLLAAGHITPAQAERLIAVSNENRETAWTLAACAFAASLTQLPSLAHLAKALAPAGLNLIHHIIRGGIQ
jgi:hypothetical protein